MTQVFALTFRLNNTDALLVLLLVTAAYAMVRAIETAGPRGHAAGRPESFGHDVNALVETYGAAIITK